MSSNESCDIDNSTRLHWNHGQAWREGERERETLETKLAVLTDIMLHCDIEDCFVGQRYSELHLPAVLER